MKRIILPFVFVLATISLQAQVYVFENLGQPISSKDSLKINRVIRHEIDFYKQFFAYDTIHIKLRIFDNKTLYWVYLKEHNIKIPHKDFTGKYSSKLGECIVFKNEETDKDAFMRSVAFLTSAHLIRTQIKKAPQWLVTGLGCHHRSSKVTKKTIKHELPSYEINRIKSMLDMKEFNLQDFLELKSKEILKRQMTDEQSSYILAHGIVYFLVNNDFTQFYQTLQKIKSGTPSYDAINSTYTGGFTQFEKDFTDYFLKK